MNAYGTLLHALFHDGSKKKKRLASRRASAFSTRHDIVKKMKMKMKMKRKK